jgi:hypothetical protein
MLRFSAAIAAAVALVLTVPAGGQERASTLPLPQPAKCERRAHPQLPPKWRASFLLAPFTKAQLMLAEITHDGSLAATRIRVYGLEHGSAEFLIIGSNTYELQSEDASVVGCRKLGDTGWRALPRDWLGRTAQCVGSAPIAEMPAEWWKIPAEPAPATNWIWFKASDRTPFRLRFERPSDRLAILSRHALSHQIAFAAAPDVDLSGVAAACKGQKVQAPSGRDALAEVFDRMARAADRAQTEIERLMPELDANCPAAPLPDWPDQFITTTFMTPSDSDSIPLPAEVIYDWHVKSQRTRMFWPDKSPIRSEDALLIGPDGYELIRNRSGRLACHGSLPGALKANWATAAPCTCAGMIKGGTPLTPYGSTRILNCPMTAPRVAWAWFAHDGRPMLFMETSSSGDPGRGLLTLVDYHAWAPGAAVAEAALKKPTQCRGSRQTETARHSDERQCPACHLGGTPAP